MLHKINNKIVNILLKFWKKTFFSDVNVFHEGLGDKIGHFFQWTATFVAGLTIGFVSGWKIAVVVLATLPLLALAGFIMNKVNSWKKKFFKYQRDYDKFVHIIEYPYWMLLNSIESINFLEFIDISYF